MIFLLPSRVLPLLLACQSDTRQAIRCKADPRGLDALLSCETYVLPPDDQWPRTLLPAWPPYNVPPQPGTLVYVRKRGIGPSRVAASVAAITWKLAVAWRMPAARRPHEKPLVVAVLALQAHTQSPCGRMRSRTASACAVALENKCLVALQAIRNRPAITYAVGL